MLGRRHKRTSKLLTMEQKIKDEAIEQLEKDIQFGFEGVDDLFENISELFYDEDDFDDEWLMTEIKERFAGHQADSVNWQKPTDFDRLLRSFDMLNAQKIVALHKAGYTRQDAEGDCAEIIDELRAMGISPIGYCYYHTQDLERAIGEEKMLLIGYDSVDGDDDMAIKIAQRIVEVLKQNGFKVKWDGSLETRIEIQDINWKKTADDIDYNYARVFEIMGKNSKQEELKTKKKKPFWKIW